MLHLRIVTFSGASVLLWAQTFNRSYLHAYLDVLAGAALAALANAKTRKQLDG